MNESISRAAGAAHGQELGAAEMERLIAKAGRRSRQRTTLYRQVDAAQHQRALHPPELTEPVVVRLTGKTISYAGPQANRPADARPVELP